MSEQEMYHLCDRSKDVFLNQPMLLELEAPINICGTFLDEFSFHCDDSLSFFSDNYFTIGNLGGQYPDLLRHFEGGGFPPKANYLFLGGYVDRGKTVS